jgi:hypothetical protein
MDIHRELERQVISYSEQGYSCFVVGDFNGRTGLQHDYTEHDTNSMYLPLDVDYRVDVNQLPRRYSADNVVNKFGRELLDVCRATGLRIVNGRFFSGCRMR